MLPMWKYPIPMLPITNWVLVIGNICTLATIMVSFAATAATCTPAATNDYYYTTPKTTSIFGRVMAETGDYRLVRQEDIAWINEAWAERMALADDGAFTTNAVPPGALVAGGVGPTHLRSWQQRCRSLCGQPYRHVHRTLP